MANSNDGPSNPTQIFDPIRAAIEQSFAAPYALAVSFFSELTQCIANQMHGMFRMSSQGGELSFYVKGQDTPLFQVNLGPEGFPIAITDLNIRRPNDGWHATFTCVNKEAVVDEVTKILRSETFIRQRAHALANQ